MTIPGKLTVRPDGRVTGPANLTYNDPFPCVNGKMGVTGAMSGVLMHTMKGNLLGTIALFNRAGADASAHFGIAQDGRIHQFGPIGKGWEAWHAMAANMTWYGIEHADGGDQRIPLSQAQVTASAQLVECLSAFAAFPLQVTDDVHGRGYGTHVMGGAAWGGHTCPGPGPRAGQRAAIVALAKLIRTPPDYVTHKATGGETAHDVAARHGESVTRMLTDSLRHFQPAKANAPELYEWVNGCFDPRSFTDAKADAAPGVPFRVPRLPS